MDRDARTARQRLRVYEKLYHETAIPSGPKKVAERGGR